MMLSGLMVCEQMALVRDGLVALLGSAWAHGPVRAAGSLAETESGLGTDPECVVLFDLGLPGAAGLATITALRARYPQTRIVALATVETQDAALRCLAAGAHGFIAKTAGFPALLAALEAVHGGGVHVPAGLAAVPAAAPAPCVQLTGRQQDVLRLLAEGRSTKDIARTLDLAVSTIKVHLAAVYRTVGARNRVEALCRAGLLPRPGVAELS